MPSLQEYQQVEDVYIAYYQRPGDPTGTRYWADRLDASGGNLNAIIDAFGNSPESLALYGPINSSTIGHVIDEIYLALFNRLPDAAGKAFYVNGFNNGTFTAASIALNVLNGAQNNDAVAVANKEQAAAEFTQTVDGRTFADPNFGQGGAFEATYVGTADAAQGRAFLAAVTANPATVPSESQTIAFIQTNVANPGDLILSVVPGVTFNLTPSIDDIHVPAGGATDLVKGFFSNAPTPNGSTLTPADSIVGNNNTIFKLAADVAGFASAPFFEMSGIGQFNIVNANGAGFLAMNGATYGSIGAINLSGADGLSVSITNLSENGGLDISVASGTGGRVYVSGSLDGLVMSASVDNANNSSLSSVSLATAGVDVVIGHNADGFAYLAQTSSDSAPAVAVGDLAIGDVNVDIGKSGSFSAFFSNWAYNSGTGTATAGNMSVGNVVLDIGAFGSAEFFASNYATATNGVATVGNLTVGNVDVLMGTSASLDFMRLSNFADGSKGATAGNVVVGNVTLDGTTGDFGEIEIRNSADAFSSGNAKVGNITVGDVAMTASSSSDLSITIDNEAFAAKGKATAGNVTVGNVTIEVGNSSSGYFSVSNTADAPGSTAAVGNVTVGNITMNGGDNGSVSAEIFNTADAGKGAATAGNVTIGNVSGSVGVSGDFFVEVENEAFGTSAALADSVGNTKVGNIDIHGSANAFIGFSLTASADWGSVGSLTIGDAQMRVENGGFLSYSVQDFAHENVGNVTIGNVDFTIGSGASLEFFDISISASLGDVAGFKVGNITINTEGLDSVFFGGGVRGLDVYAHDDLGNVTLGNVLITLAKSASLAQSWTFEADTGSIGNISEGNITVSAAQNADNFLGEFFSADDEIGNVTVGNITVSAAKSADATLYHEVFNNDDIGTITYGNIGITANGANSFAYAFISAENDDSHDIGAITAGNITMVSKGAGAGADLTMSFTSADTIGPVKVGNVSIDLSQTAKGAAALATNFLEILDQGGPSDLTIGDIKISNSSAPTAAWVGTEKVSADFFISSEDGITIGNISVVGGQKAAGVVLDNFSDLKALLDLHAGAAGITVGNIDYSGYAAAATIDVSAWKGAAAITASKGGSTISDNATKNVITLGAGTDTVNITNKNTGKADPNAVDQIINFTSGTDKLSLDLAGSDFAYNGVSTTYAQFLINAGSAMSTNGIDIYSQRIGSDSFIGFDKDGNGSLDFVVEVVGVQVNNIGDFVIV